MASCRIEQQHRQMVLYRSKILLLERNTYETEVSELSESNARLREEVRQTEDTAVREKRTLQAKIDAVELEKVSLQNNIHSLETQLSSAPTRSIIESMKRELRILKRLEYNAEENNVDNDDIDKDRNPESTASGNTSSALSDENDLEAVLGSTLRHAEKELILERNLKNGLSEQVESMHHKLVEVTKSKEDCERLIASLENNLQRAKFTSNTNTDANETPTQIGYGVTTNNR
jgi:chromosome segregation ATPase